MKEFLKRLTTFFLAMLMLLSVPTQAFAQSLENNRLNELEIIPAKPGENETAENFIKNPEQPNIYTLRTDFKVQKGEKYEVNYQPYVASVGEAATQDEKNNVNKTIDLPDLAGYKKPQDSFSIDYNQIKEKAEKGSKTGNNTNGYVYKANQSFNYDAVNKEIKIKHVFQELEDFNKYGLKPGRTEDLITTQSGNTGSTLEVRPLDEKDRKGFIPEAKYLTTQVPDNTDEFEIEYRYNRAHFNMVFDTLEGTEVPSRTLYYGQVIPSLDQNSLPTKEGCEFVGWKPSVDIEGRVNGVNKTFKAGELITDGTNPVKDLNASLTMPAVNVTFTAEWKEKEKADYTILFWAEKSDYNESETKLRDRYDFIGVRREKDASTGSRPDLNNLSIKNIPFPDLSDDRLEKIWNNSEEFSKYYVLNKELTKTENASKKDANVQKAVSSTGSTVYNVYYDRRVYDIYFTKNYDKFEDFAFFPTLKRDGNIIGKEGDPYHFTARFNQNIHPMWPKDSELIDVPELFIDEQQGPVGWTLNTEEDYGGEDRFRDTPPYRLSAEDFIDADIVNDSQGWSKTIPIGKGKDKERGKYEISLGVEIANNTAPHHVDFLKDDFEGKGQYDYDLYYCKSDTNIEDYEFPLPNLQGFTLKEKNEASKWFTKNDLNKINEARKKITPFRSESDAIKFVDKFSDDEESFESNGHLVAKYFRNKYKLKLNNDPRIEKDEVDYVEGKDKIDVFYERPLKDLNLDTEKKPNRPDWVPDNWEFKGYSIDPSGENLVRDGNETMPARSIVLYAKWGEPDYKWKVTFDPNGGNLASIDVDKITKTKKTILEGDVGEEKQVSYPIKEGNVEGKQVFTLINHQQLLEPTKPTRKGYNFLGWEVIRYKKDADGNYTEMVDSSYKDIYKVPELYSFGNDVVSPVYLKAIWVPNKRVDIKVEHYKLDKDYNLDATVGVNPEVEYLRDKRAESLVATTGDKQNEEWILASHDELENNLTGKLKETYENYNERVKLNNGFFQTFRVEPEQILQDGELVDNPKFEDNVFKFFYRRFRTRNYKVNYVDVRAKSEIEAATSLEEKSKIIAANRIVDQEEVESKCRHYDARNYRPIKGWKLVSEPQQQLFYDVNEDTNEFIGINGTGSDEITFYYQDVRVIEVKKDDPVPEGYVRVIFKADEGGSFTDKDGNSVKELYYDVIKGLKSDFLPVPENPTENKAEFKHYITPDDGKNFIKWDKKPLLNSNTIIENDEEGFYVFTAQFEWSGVAAKELVITEAFEDPNNIWTNDFAPKVEDLKKQLVWKEKDQEKPLPADATVTIVDESGNPLTDKDIYEKVKEAGALDRDELVRTINFKAQVKFKDGRNTKELDIPVKIYKNVYEALTTGEKPLFLSQAEVGELKNITGNYVKVTVNPTGKPSNKDSKIYYVNPKAWVNIPEVDISEDMTKLGVTNWSADRDEQNENNEANGIFDFNKRHMFTEDTIISPSFAKDVVEEKDGEGKPKVPDTFVKVIVKSTDKAKEEFEKTFWVNPTKEVTIPVVNPTGKENQKVTIEGLGEKDVTFVFKEWQKIKVGEADDKLSDITPEKIDLASHQYTEKVTVIEAVYKNSIQAEKIDDPLKTNKLDVPQGKTIEDKDLIDKITPQDGKEIDSITIIENPDTSEPGSKEAKVIVKYKDGTTQGTNDEPVVIPVEVHKNVIPEAPGGQRPKDAMDNYVKVIFKAGIGGTLSGDTVYYVSPEVEVDMTESAANIKKTPDTGYISGDWDTNESKKLKGIFNVDTEFIFNFTKSDDIVEKTDENPNKPDGYVTVTFKTDGNGKVNGEDEKVYFVNPNAGIKLGKSATADNKTLVVPVTTANENFTFKEWQEAISETDPITSDRTYVAIFQSGKVTLTYDANGGIGDVPSDVTVDYGTKIRIAGQGNLENGDRIFVGWKIGETIYRPGDQVTLNEDTTAIAVWEDKALDDVIEVTPGGTKPDGYVTVIVNPTEKAKDSTEKSYWVNPEKIVNIPAQNPESIEPDYVFNGWDQPLTQQFETDTTITAKYAFLGSSSPTSDYVFTKVGVQPGSEDYQKVITPPADKIISSVDIVELPDVSRPGLTSANVKINYDDGTSEEIIVKVYVEREDSGESRPYPDPYPYPIPSPTPSRPLNNGFITITEYKDRELLRREVRYMQGFEGKFRPKDSLTRAEAAQILANALKEDGYKFDPAYKLSYKDIQGQEWYVDAIRITTQADVFKGYDDGNFRPDQKITRAEWIATLRRFQYIDNAEGNSMKLRSDHWAISEVEAAYKEGWLKIYQDGLADFAYDKAITRQEVAAVSNKAFNRVLDKKFILDKNHDLINYSDISPDMWAYEDILCASNTFLHKSQGKYLGYESGPKTYSIDIKDAVVEQDLFQRISR